MGEEEDCFFFSKFSYFRKILQHYLLDPVKNSTVYLCAKVIDSICSSAPDASPQMCSLA